MNVPPVEITSTPHERSRNMKPMARTSYTRAAALAVTVLSLGTGLMTVPAIAKDGRDGKDFGWQVERMLDTRSQQLFGIRGPLERSADDAAFTGPGNEAVLAAEGLTVELIS